MIHKQHDDAGDMCAMQPSVQVSNVFSTQVALLGMHHL
jgi:hypothetical protein